MIYASRCLLGPTMAIAFCMALSRSSPELRDFTRQACAPVLSTTWAISGTKNWRDSTITGISGCLARGTKFTRNSTPGMSDRVNSITTQSTGSKWQMASPACPVSASRTTASGEETFSRCFQYARSSLCGSTRRIVAGGHTHCPGVPMLVS